MEYFQMTPKDISDAKKRGEDFLFRVVENKFTNTLKAVRQRRNNNIDADIDEIIDWPVRLEAYAYLGHKHKELIPRYAQEVRELWDGWIQLMDRSKVKDKRIFWPTTDAIAISSESPVLEDFRLEGIAAFWEAPEAAIECHVAMFKTKETLGIGGYEPYFENARQMIGNLLISKHLFDDSLTRRILWQISRSGSLRKGLKDHIKLVVPLLKNIIAEQEEEVSAAVNHAKDVGVDGLDLLRSIRMGMFEIDFWANIGFFLALNNLGKEMSELARTQSLKMLDRKSPNGGFDDNVEITCLALSYLKLVDADPSMTAYISPLAWLLKQQEGNGYWPSTQLSDKPMGHVGNLIFKDALVPYKVRNTVMALETIDLIRNLQPLPNWSIREWTDVFRVKREVRLQAIVPFPTPEGATWDMVRIRFLSEEAAELSVGDVREGRDFCEMGFRDKRKNRPDQLWHLLRFIGKNHGEFTFDTKGLPLHPWHIKSQMKDIRKRLIHLFHIDGDPFFPYRSIRAYRAKFIIGSDEN
jgi:hypothetical protein